MSKPRWKNLCFPSFIKCLPTSDQPSNHFDYHTIPPPPPPSTTATCTSHLIKDVFNTIGNDFNLINSPSDPDNTSTSKCLTSSSQDDFFSVSSSDSDSDHFSPPNFDTVLASDRFFFSSPGPTNSIIQSPNATIPTTNTDACNTNSQKRKLVTRGVRVPKYSSNPYMDFRKSMKEMLEANQEKMLVEYGYGTSTSDDMEYLHELLLCYLSLNPKHAHRDIISAFTDLVIGLLSVSLVPLASEVDYENVKSGLISKS